MVCALVIAFASATQDIVVDGWRIDSAPTERQGMMLASYQLGYSLARICAGAGALFVADAFGWAPAYASMAALMLLAVAGTLAAPKVQARDPGPGAAGATPCARRWSTRSRTWCAARARGWC